jgi:hypothetical protein
MLLKENVKKAVAEEISICTEHCGVRVGGVATCAYFLTTF